MRPALLLYNPVAGRGRAPRLLAEVRAELRRAGWDAEPEATTAPGDATVRSRAAAERGAEAVFALGGDGTLREAAAGLLGAGTVLGYLPAGTAKVMARQLRLPSRPLAAARAMAGAATRDMDVGLVDGEPFLMQVSAGLDALAIARLRPRWKRLLRQAAIVPAGLPAWWRYGYPPLEVETGGETLRGSFAVIANIPFYGGPWKIAPAARADDRRLDLVVFTGRGRLATLGLARDVLFGRLARRRDVVVRSVTEATLRGPIGLPAQVDGDRIRREPPLAIGLAAAPLRVLVGRKR